MDSEEQQLDLGTHLLEADRGSATIVFDYTDLHSFSRYDTDDYSSTRTLAMEQLFMVTFEFEKKRFDELLKLLAKAGAAQLERELGSKAFIDPMTINIPPGALYIGIRTHLGEPRITPDETRHVGLQPGHRTHAEDPLVGVRRGREHILERMHRHHVARAREWDAAVNHA